MTYKSLSDLPDSIKNTLPFHAQEVYRAAFNDAWVEYESPSKRSAKASREETAHKVAWAAVRTKYLKEGLEWKGR